MVYHFSRGLHRRAEEGVRRAAQDQSLVGGKLYKLRAELRSGRQRLFAVDVLARHERRLRHGVMLVGTGDVQYDVNVFVTEELVHILINARDAVFRHGALRLLADQVAHADDLHLAEEAGQIFQVDPADGADADEAYSHFSHVRSPLRELLRPRAFLSP